MAVSVGLIGLLRATGFCWMGSLCANSRYARESPAAVPQGKGGGGYNVHD